MNKLDVKLKLNIQGVQWDYAFAKLLQYLPD